MELDHPKKYVWEYKRNIQNRIWQSHCKHERVGQIFALKWVSQTHFDAKFLFIQGVDEVKNPINLEPMGILTFKVRLVWQNRTEKILLRLLRFVQSGFEIFFTLCFCQFLCCHQVKRRNRNKVRCVGVEN